MKKTAVEVITDWIEKNIETIYYPSMTKESRAHFNSFDSSKMVFNREFVLSSLSGVMPDVKKILNKPKSTKNT